MSSIMRDPDGRGPTPQPIELRQRLEWRDDEETGWDHDTGAVEIGHVARAIQVWSVYQTDQTTVAQASAAFNLSPQTIIEAVESHGWMFLTGPRDDFDQLIIEHEGE